MKKVLILGQTSLLGQHLKLISEHSKKLQLFFTSREKVDYVFDANNPASIKTIIDEIQPHYLINCIAETTVDKDNLPRLYYLNTVLPLYLSNQFPKLRYIHISTDAVFPGKKGNYTISSTIEPCKQYADYSISKYLAEMGNYYSIIRGSFFGINQLYKKGMYNWVLSTKEPIRGYTNHWFTPLTAYHFAKSLLQLLERNTLPKIVHLSSPYNTSKYQLIEKILKVNKIKKPLTKATQEIDTNLCLIPNHDLEIPDIIEQLHEYKKWSDELSLKPCNI